MHIVNIEKNINGDSRVADHEPTIREFERSNYLHIEDVKNLVDIFCQGLRDQAKNHDWSKIQDPYKSMFYRDLCNTISGKIKFEDGEWHKLHYEELERHHLKKCVPDDVNLFDVIEMLCDCVAAGMARSGEIRDVDLDPEVLTKAVANTVELLKGSVNIVEGRE